LQHIPTKLDHENEFIAGAVALDFANTVGGSRQQPTHDHVTRYADLVTFAKGAGYLTESQLTSLIAQAKADPVSAMSVLSRAITLRDSIWAVFPTDQMSPKARDLTVISTEAARAASHMRLGRGDGAFAWTWGDELEMDRVIWPIARSAAELLTSEAQRRSIRECESERCSWLFLDKTRNHSRRWCDMGDCGNRAKARRFRERRSHRTASATR
jgi:predicted RNA-binding Zn ribbon-like protein